MSYIKRKVLISHASPQVCAHVGTLIALVAGISSTCRHAGQREVLRSNKNKHQISSELVGLFVSVRDCRFVVLGSMNFGRFLALSWNTFAYRFNAVLVCAFWS